MHVVAIVVLAVVVSIPVLVELEVSIPVLVVVLELLDSVDDAVDEDDVLSYDDEEALDVGALLVEDVTIVESELREEPSCVGAPVVVVMSTMPAVLAVLSASQNVCPQSPK